MGASDYHEMQEDIEKLSRALREMLESYDLLMVEILPEHSICEGTIKGAFQNSPKLAREVLEEIWGEEDGDT